MNQYAPSPVFPSNPATQPFGSGPPQAPQSHQFRFTGTTSEYFRIWLVNVALTLVTLGIYSAWAKVRTKQYFYRHTWLDNTSFEYLASPISILKGRLIIAAFFGALLAAQQVHIGLYLSLFAVFVLAMPWLIVRSLAFNARNSAYRNISYHFDGSAPEAAGLYLLMLLLHMGTCGLGYPYAQWRFSEFIIERHLFGDLRLKWHTQTGQYYAMFGIALLLSLFGMLFFIGGAIGGAALGESGGETLVTGAVLLGYALMIIPSAYVKAQTANLVYGGTSIGPHRLAANQNAKEVLGLYVTNLLAVLFSLGLAIPWAKIRLAKYRAEHLYLWAQGPIVAENYAMASGGPSAIGEAAADLGDIGFDIGL